MFFGIVALLIVTLKVFPDTEVARTLRDYLIVRPTEWLATAQRHHIFFVSILLVLLIMPETLMLLAAADLSLVTFALDVSLYIDAIIAIWLLGFAFRVQAAWHAVRDLATRPMRRGKPEAAVMDPAPPRAVSELRPRAERAAA